MMAREFKLGLSMALVLGLLGGGAAMAEPQHEHQGGGGGERGGGRPAARPAEPHPGPSGYQRVAEPHGWNNRPAAVDRGAYQHNFQAARSYRIGPYHRPPGWTARRWSYGDILPRAFWAPQYLLADYWLFALEVPPAGYEWVRNGADAMLVDINSGEILQVEYGVFS
jgi:Ni/Co efflux regulator RcnB